MNQIRQSTTRGRARAQLGSISKEKGNLNDQNNLESNLIKRSGGARGHVSFSSFSLF